MKSFVIGKIKKQKMLEKREDIKGVLRQCFADGLNDKESCALAGISTSTLLRYYNENPDFKLEREELKHNLTGKAKRNIARKIEEGDINTSRWVLEKLDREEFGDKPINAIQANFINKVVFEVIGSKEVENVKTVEHQDS